MSKTIVILRGRDKGQPFVPGAEAFAGLCVLAWAQRIGIQERAVLVCDDPVLLSEARRMGFRVSKTEPAEVWDAIEKIAHELGADNVVECPLHMPFREDWLLEEVEAALEKEPSARVETVSELPGEPGRVEPDGCLVGRSLVWEFRHSVPSVFVRHHGVCNRRIVTHVDLCGARFLRLLEDEIGSRYPRLAPLSGRAAVVGGSDSIVGSKAGREIDAADAVIRVHGARSFSVEDSGDTCTYIFGHDVDRINDAAERWEEAKIVSSQWPMPAVFRTVSTLGVTPEILNSARGMTGIRDMISTGFIAVMWALCNGAEHVLIAGFGGCDHRGAIKDDYDKIWRDAEDDALDRLAREGLVTWLD